jgi:hypothetical protein
MRRKSKKKLRARLRHRRFSERGFALPIALGLGLIMILIGATMIVRSQGDQITALAQKNTAQSLTVNEAGVTRSISILNQPNTAFLLKLNYDPINPDTDKTYLGPNGILNSGDEETAAVDQWSSLPSSIPCSSSISAPTELISSATAGAGSYQVKAYRYRDPDGTPNTGDEIGTLLVEGTQGNAVSRVQVSTRIVQYPLTGSFAGLYGSNIINLGNNDVLATPGGSGSAANVVCKDCKVPADQCSANGPTPDGLRQAVGAKTQNSTIAGNILINDPQLPPVPTTPATPCSATSGPNCSTDLSSLDASTTPELPRPQDIANRVAWQASHPTTWSASTASEPYYYVITDMPLGNNVLTVNTTAAPVYLHVSGNITVSGSKGTIAHTGSPERLRIYGNPEDPTDSRTDQEFKLNGGASTSNLFIYAPDATMGISGGSSTPDIQGAVWIKTWDGSNSNRAEIVVPDNMAALLGGSFVGVGIQTYGSSAPNNWQRQPVATD